MAMESQDLSLAVIVNDVKIPQYAHEKNHRTYVEVDLEGPTSFKRHTVEETPWGPEPRNDPVTPYKIQVTNHTDSACWGRVLVDGKSIWYGYVGPRRSEVVDKVVIDGENHELVFCWPRFPTDPEQSDEPEPNEEPTAGTIVAHLYRAHLQQRGVFMGPTAAESVDFEQSTKKDAKKAQIAEQGGHVSTTALGRSLGKAAPQQAGMRDTYTIDKGHFVQKCLHYREGHTLRNLGLDVPTRKPAADSPEDTKEGVADKKRPREEDDDVLDLTL